MRAIVQFGLVHLGVQRIAADCWADDSLAELIFEGTEMQREACFVEVARVDGQWRSMLIRAAVQECDRQLFHLP